MLKHCALLVLTCALVGAPAVAAGSDDETFDGNWKLDLEQSDERPNIPLMETDMKVAVGAEKIEVTRTFHTAERGDMTFPTTYITDGKPHEVQNPLGGTMQVRARQKKRKLEFSYTLSRNTPRGAFEMDIVESWSINKDGELSILFSTRLGDRNITRREIYRPAPDETEG